MKYIGIDYGLRRIGIASSDAGVYAKPLGVIANKGDRKNIEAIRAYTTADCCVVCGIPLYGDGNETEMSRECRRFGELLGRELGVMVHFQNEFGTSKDAEKEIAQKKLRYSIDELCASMILQMYLDHEKRGKHGI